MNLILKKILTFYEQILQYDVGLANLLVIAAVQLLALLVFLLSRFLLSKIIKRVSAHTANSFDDRLNDKIILRRFSYVPALLTLNAFVGYLPAYSEVISVLINVAIVSALLLGFAKVISISIKFVEETEVYREKPIKGYLQILNIVLYSWGIILILGLLTGENPWTLVTGLSAFTAILLLVFKDTLLSFVASLQISSYNLVQKGDWITVAKYDADGDVIDIALHTIKVQNFDKTITVIPTYKLIEESFKNWRGMQESGGRRLKRTLFIDLSSIRFVDDELIERFKNYQFISEYLESRQREIAEYNLEHNYDMSNPVNGRRMTNIGTFRAYLEHYLYERKDIRKDMPFMVRQLQSGAEGLPIELYVFVNTTEWREYENIQSDIFDHIFAIVQEFDLRLYQQPSGNDMKHFGRF